jgi:soluble lytic murein transglycosylase-like protein
MKAIPFILSLMVMFGAPVVVTAPPSTDATPVPQWVYEQERLVEIINQWPLADQSIVEEVSMSVAAWSQIVDVDPVLVLAVMRVENPWLIPDTVSSAGAVGLMQVMPRYWSESYSHCGIDLTEIDTNICKGVNVLRYYLDRHDGDFNEAMLAYNGCLSDYCRVYTANVMRYLD